MPRKFESREGELSERRKHLHDGSRSTKLKLKGYSQVLEMFLAVLKGLNNGFELLVGSAKRHRAKTFRLPCRPSMSMNGIRSYIRGKCSDLSFPSKLESIAASWSLSQLVLFFRSRSADISIRLCIRKASQWTDGTSTGTRTPSRNWVTTEGILSFLSIYYLERQSPRKNTILMNQPAASSSQLP